MHLSRECSGTYGIKYFQSIFISFFQDLLKIENQSKTANLEQKEQKNRTERLVEKESADVLNAKTFKNYSRFGHQDGKSIFPKKYQDEYHGFYHKQSWATTSG